MKFIFAFVSLLSLSTSAFAYNEGTFTCKNAEGLPGNTYKIENVSVAGASLPYVEITRHYKSTDGQPADTVIRGIAVVSSSERNGKTKEILALAAVRLEFDDQGNLVNCRK